jgi:class 3 adenylate cyclase
LVVVGDLIGPGEAQERGIVGETPNLAARLQSIAEPKIVVIAESTRKLLGNLFDLPEQQFGFLCPPDEVRQAARMQGFEPACDGNRPHRRPGVYRQGNA